MRSKRATDGEMKQEDKKRCSVCEIPYFERNNYFYGKLMTVRDFFAEQCYFNEKRWLVNRMVLGWGIVCGLDVQQKEGSPGEVVVTPGLAIDCCGREVLVCDEQVVKLLPAPSGCHKEKEEETGEKKLFICIEYRECRTEPVQLPPVACDQKEKGEFNRIRDSFRFSVAEYRETSDEILPCPSDAGTSSMHEYVCKTLQEGCPDCTDSKCLLLATVTVDQSGNLVGEIDTCSRRPLVYRNPLLYDLIECLHHNYIGTWLVLGPIFNVNHQTQHSPADGHPLAKEIIDGFEANVFKPDELTGDISKAPVHGKTIHYKNGVLDIAGEYEWQTRGFLSMDWMNIHDIEDNIHQHLPGDHSDPFNPENPLNFAGKHHTLAYFLVYIISPKKRETRLFVRSDDSLRVWLNGQEITALQYKGEKDIKDFKEVSALITLNEGYNVLMTSVAETHYEWGFSAWIENNGGLRFTTLKYD